MKFFVLCHDVNLEIYYSNVFRELSHVSLVVNETDFAYLLSDFDPEFIIIDESTNGTVGAGMIV